MIDGMGGNQLIYRSSYDFPSFSNIYINIHEYANKIICISNLVLKGLCLSFNLILFCSLG